MPDLLFELFSEEIPARMQAGAAENLKSLVTDALVARGLLYEGARAVATPRRLALVVQGLPARQPDVREERKGPRVGAPEAAVQGFLKSAGLSDLSQAKVEHDPKKGDFYVAVIDKPGRATLDVLAEVLPQVIRGFPWPKSMRWGSGSLRWVRPLHAVVASFGPETEEPQVVPFEVDGLKAGDTTFGHRFLAPGPIKVKRWADYLDRLEKAHVVADPERRKAMILGDARTLAFAQGFELVEDAALLDEVAGLVEWPVVLMGRFDPAFLAIPPEVIRSTIRANQKCFVLRRADGTLADRFLLVSNMVASDGGHAIVAGNERVIRARLADAKFFFETDLARRLEDRLPKLDGIVFHQKLGTQGERIARIERLAAELAPLVGADVEKTKRAAQLCKLDLVTEVVGEFPELQGLMGKYYALAQGEDASVAAACEEHYKPVGPSDRVPTDPVSIAVALADKIDTLYGFWTIDERPTGSKDPYALRRAALGVIRVVLENQLRIRLVHDTAAISTAAFLSHLYGERVTQQAGAIGLLERSGAPSSLLADVKNSILEQLSPDAAARLSEDTVEQSWQIAVSLLAFFADRLKVLLREQGARHDLVDAVFALEDQDDLVLIVRRIEALGRFLDSDDGRSLLAGYRRAANILRIEEKKDKRAFAGAPDPALLSEDAERALAAAIGAATAAASAAVAREDFAAAMAALATLRAPVDAFFDGVTVNAEDAALRENRLKLLNEIRAATRAVADFSKIEG